MKLSAILISLLLLVQPVSSALADEMDDLAALGEGEVQSVKSTEDNDLASLSDDDSLDSMGDASDTSSTEEEPEKEEASKPYNFGGYVKPLIYWSHTEYSDDMWGLLKLKKAAGLSAPEKQEEEKYTDSGARVQLKLEGFLSDSARLFTAVNIDYNEVKTNEESATKTRVVESYVELFEGSRTWKIGNQLITWGFMEGIEVPTDRLNARDNQYNSTEYEDSKLASSGIYLKQSLGGFSSLDFFYAPVSQKNVDADYLSYFVNEPKKEEDHTVDRSKKAIRLFVSAGNFDFALSHVQGLDAAFDIDASGDSPLAPSFNPDATYYKTYNKVDSSSLDLQYNFGSFLAKAAYVQNITADKDGDDKYTKNSWSKYLYGVEFNAGGLTYNVYTGQQKVEDFDKLENSNQVIFLAQPSETLDFVSGHINGSFLTGDALGVTILFASYWDDEGKAVQQMLMPTFTYKVANGLELAFAGSHVEYYETKFQKLKAEVKYSF